MKQATVVEVIITYISVGWATAFLTNPRLFENSASFNKIEYILKYEWVLGSVALICALVKMLGIFLKSIRLRRLGLVMSALFWIFVATGILVAQGHVVLNSGFVVYSGLAIMCFWTSKEVMYDDQPDERDAP